jgi:hypothetical protein
VPQERLADAQNAQTAADAEAKAADIKTKHLAKQAAEQRKGLASKDKEASGMRKQLDDAQRKVDACTQKLAGLSYDAAAVEQLEGTRQREVAEVRAAKEAVEVLGAQLSTLDFHYRCVGLMHWLGLLIQVQAVYKHIRMQAAQSCSGVRVSNSGSWAHSSPHWSTPAGARS